MSADLPLRNLEKGDVGYQQVGEIASGACKAAFFKASWNGGEAMVRDIYCRNENRWILLNRPEQRFEEQCVYPSAQPSTAGASMVDSQLNAFAGVLTKDFYKPLFRPDSTEKRLVRTGRLITVAQWIATGLCRYLRAQSDGR